MQADQRGGKCSVIAGPLPHATARLPCSNAVPPHRQHLLHAGGSPEFDTVLTCPVRAASLSSHIASVEEEQGPCMFWLLR